MRQKGTTMGASNYPLNLLLSEIIEERASCEAAFITGVLGYRDEDVDKGLRRLHLWTETGEGHQRIIDHISRVTGRGEALKQAIVATREMRVREREQAFLEECQAEAETFRPFLYAVGTHSVPRGICIFGLSGGHRRWTIINIPQSLLDLPLEDQLPALLPLMDQYKRERGGEVLFFGTLTGFNFVRLVDHFRFDSEGGLIEHVKKPFSPGVCSVGLV